MNDVAIVKEGWLHKRGQCLRALPAEGPELGPWLLGGWGGLGCGCWACGASLDSGSSPGAVPGPRVPTACRTQGPQGLPGGNTHPRLVCSRLAEAAGGENHPLSWKAARTGAHPRPGTLVAQGTARGLLRAGQGWRAWPRASLGRAVGRRGLCTAWGPVWGGLALVQPGCLACPPPSLPPACPCAPVPREGLSGSWWDGAWSRVPHLAALSASLPSVPERLDRRSGELDRVGVEVSEVSGQVMSSCSRPGVG